MTNDLLPWRHARALSRLPHEFKGALAWRGDGAHRVGWTIAEAAVRSNARSVAMSLANERLALKPRSHINRRFLALAQRT